MRQRTRQRLARGGAYAAALAVLLAVFFLYTRPAFIVTLAEQVWLCFQ